MHRATLLLNVLATAVARWLIQVVLPASPDHAAPVSNLLPPTAPAFLGGFNDCRCVNMNGCRYILPPGSVVKQSIRIKINSAASIAPASAATLVAAASTTASTVVELGLGPEGASNVSFICGLIGDCSTLTNILRHAPAARKGGISPCPAIGIGLPADVAVAAAELVRHVFLFFLIIGYAYSTSLILASPTSSTSSASFSSFSSYSASSSSAAAAVPSPLPPPPPLPPPLPPPSPPFSSSHSSRYLRLARKESSPYLLPEVITAFLPAGPGRPGALHRAAISLLLGRLPAAGGGCRGSAGCRGRAG